MLSEFFALALFTLPVELMRFLIPPDAIADPTQDPKELFSRFSMFIGEYFEEMASDLAQISDQQTALGEKQVGMKTAGTNVLHSCIFRMNQI